MEPTKSASIDILRQMFGATGDGIVVVDAEGSVQYCNSAAAELLGHSEQTEKDFELAVPAGSVRTKEMPAGPDGPQAPVRLRFTDMTWNGQPAFLVMVQESAAVRESGATAKSSIEQAASDKLQASESRFRHLFENSIDAIIIADAQGGFCEVNPAAAELFGMRREELANLSVGELEVPESELSASTRFREYAKQGEEQGTFVFRRNGELRVAEYSAFRLETDRFVSILRDVTEKRSMEEKLNQSQKMEAVGQLGGGIAHEFNNLLTAIISFITFARDELEPGDVRRDDLDEALEAAGRGSSLTRQLLTFSRKQPVNPEPIDLNEAIQGSIQLLDRTLGEHIRITINLATDLPPVVFDRGQLVQVLLNLGLNARDAMPSGGDLHIQTALGSRPELGDCVQIIVSDSGHGIERDALSRVFEPFFTTKEVGKGTGLGLSLVYGAVTFAGGDVSVESRPGDGATFCLSIPRAPEDLLVTPLAPKSLAGPVDGDETILVIEDEPLVRKAVVRILGNHGFDVLQASNGLEAIAALARWEGDIDLIVSDVIMPELNGPQAVEQIRESRPNVQVLFMTGYTDEALDRHGGLPDDTAIIEKPFEDSDLLSAVRRLLDRPANPQPEAD